MGGGCPWLSYDQARRSEQPRGLQGWPRLRSAREVRQGPQAGVQPGEDGPLRAGDEGEDPRAAEAFRRGSGQADQGKGGGDREGGEVLHGRGGQAPEDLPEAPGGQGSDGYGREGVWPRAHEVREGCCRQGGALNGKTI